MFLIAPRRLKCSIVIMRCPSSSPRCLSVVGNFSHFWLLLWNCWTEFDKTLHEATCRSQHPRQSLCFFGPIRKTRGPPWPLICWDIFDFSSETTEQNSTKLDRKQDLNVLNQVCVFWADQKNKWPPWSLIGWDIFDFSSETALRSSTICFGQGRIQGGAKIGHWMSPSSKNFVFRPEGYSDKQNAYQWSRSMWDEVLLFPRNALRLGYSNAAVVPSFRPSVDLVNTIETTSLNVSLSNLADMLTMMRGRTLLILGVRGQRSRSQWTYIEIGLWTQ